MKKLISFSTLTVAALGINFASVAPASAMTAEEAILLCDAHAGEGCNYRIHEAATGGAITDIFYHGEWIICGAHKSECFVVRGKKTHLFGDIVSGAGSNGNDVGQGQSGEHTDGGGSKGKGRD
jgi:hypothetical protein